MLNRVLSVTSIAAITVAALAGCSRAEATPQHDRGAPRQAAAERDRTDAVAVVNGVPIYREDVQFRSAGSHHGKEAKPNESTARNVLDTIIREELAKQQALRLGLDGSKAYHEQLRRLEARVKAFKRQELANLFFRKQIVDQVQVTDDEAKAYFDQNGIRIRTELHVWQILYKGDEAKIHQAKKKLDNGMAFERVAAERFGKALPANETPWDLGYLRWNQIPEAWRDVVYGMKPGEVSGIIKNPNHRFWIIKLIDKRVDPDMDFAKMKPTIVELLRNEKILELRKTTDADLKKDARIEYLDGPSA